MKKKQNNSEQVQHEGTADERIEGSHYSQIFGDRDKASLRENMNKDRGAFCILELLVTSYCTYESYITSLYNSGEDNHTVCIHCFADSSCRHI